MTTTTITRQTVQQLQAEAVRLLAQLAEAQGLTVRYGGGRFTSASATIKFEFATKGENGAPGGQLAEDFKRWCIGYHLKPEDLGRSFPYRRKEYKIVGLNANARTAPIICQSTDGKQYKFPAALVVTCLAQRAADTEAAYDRYASGRA